MKLSHLRRTQNFLEAVVLVARVCYSGRKGHNDQLGGTEAEGKGCTQPAGETSASRQEGVRSPHKHQEARSAA